MQKLITKYPDIATLGRHNSAAITNRRKFSFKLTLYGMSSFHIFTVRIIQSFPWAVRSTQARTPPQFIRDFRIVSCRNGDISQSHAANHHPLLSDTALCIIECSK